MENKLLLISLTDGVGGAEQCLKIIAKETKSPIFFLKKTKENSLKEIDILSVKYLTNLPLIFGFLLLPFSLFKYRKSHSIITSHSYLNATVGFLHRIGFLKKNVIVRESTNIFNRYLGFKLLTYKVAYKLGYPTVSKIICQNNLMANQLLKNNLFINKSKVKVIPNPINYIEALSKSNFKQTEIINDYICAAGRLIPIKGFDLLINAFAVLAKKHQNLKLVILGDGTEKDNLLKLISDLDLKKSVYLLGFKDNPFPYFKQAKLCVVSSIMEGFPNVLLQMMAVNNSIVSTLCAGGISDIPSITKVKVNCIGELVQGIEKELATEKSNRDCNKEYLELRSPKSYVEQLLSIEN